MKDKKEIHYSLKKNWKYKKKNIPTRNNTIISDPVFFNRVRILFDNSKSKNVKLFDYSDNVDLIIRIQTLFRSLLGKRKFRILKYVSHKIIQIQKIIKGMITRRKFHFFIKEYYRTIDITIFFIKKISRKIIILFNSNYPIFVFLFFIESSK